MRRMPAIFCASLILACLLLVPMAAGVSAATASAAGFACDPHGTTGGSPTTKLSTVTIDTTTPANSTLTCLFRGTRLPLSTGGLCRFANGTFLIDFARRILLPVNGNTNLICSGAASISQTTDLSITKTDGVGSAVPGTTTTYTIVATNNGPNPIAGASVADTLPAAIVSGTFTAVGAGGASGFTASGAGNIADTVSLPVGASVTYTVTAHIDPSARGSLANTATVALPAGLTDPVPGNNSATDTDTLTPQVDLVVTIDDGVTSVPVGTTTTWTVTVTNNGPSTATNLDGGSSTVGCNCVGFGFNFGAFHAAIPTLLPGASDVSSIVGTPQAGVTITATATYAVAEPDTNPANNTAADTDTIT